MNSQSSNRSIVPTFTDFHLFADWIRKNLLELEKYNKTGVSKKERADLAIKIYNCILENFHLFDSSHNSFINTVFSRLVYLRREHVEKEDFKDIDRIIDSFIEKKNNLVCTYVESIETKEELIKFCKYFKKYHDNLSGRKLLIELLLTQKFFEDLSKIILIYHHLGSYAPPRFIYNYNKIKRVKKVFWKWKEITYQEGKPAQKARLKREMDMDIDILENVIGYKLS